MPAGKPTAAKRLHEKFQRRRTPIGLHGTREWNAHEIKRWGGSEVFFYEIPAGKNAQKISQTQLVQRLYSSIFGNVDYWAKKHMPNIDQFLQFPGQGNFPAIVLVRKPKESLRDRNWFPREGKKQTFVPYSAEMEPRHVQKIVSITPEEFDRIKKQVKPSRFSSKVHAQLLKLLSIALYKKVQAYLLETK